MRRGGMSVGAVLLALVVGGCGTASPPYDTTGVDELVVPTPSPDPGDFVQGIDNPWLSYAPGNEWTYDVQVPSGHGTRTVTVEPSNLRLDGVAVTSVRTVTQPAGPGQQETTTDYYAQDRQGNVWWFGRQGVWDVEVEGAEAGLAMPADPRVGDGWRLARLDGVVEDRVTVESVDGDDVILNAESPLVPGVVIQQSYHAGVGLERTSAVEGPPTSSTLVDGP